MQDKIHIKGLKIYAYHGVNPEEKRDGQPFVLDITLYLDLSRPCQSDCVDDTVSYAKAVKTINRTFLEAKYDLIEKAAQRVAEDLLQTYPALKRVDVLLKKPQAPVKADFDYVAVEISRSRMKEE